ncbi:hypothetical protein [Streptomyces sp. ST2-7A]|uniref:hypothetical protein n=1 Tax=Streptomyces sp. ST2-7A TaxID=2907214 RepID=UPI001F36FE1E|nr:hypothetical protein [Streptomyces sp. ST2-7A]MCE7082158.1 hypothetical protein [Streptomyces sp. ST2-7A]
MSGGTSRNGRLRTVVAGVAGAALLLTGCSSSDTGEENDPIAGAETAPAEPVEEEADDEANGGDEAAEEPEDSIERPEIDLGDDLENVYEDKETGDPVKDAILRDSQGFQDAVAEGLVHHETNRPAMTFYLTGEALANSVQLVQSAIDQGLSSTGTSMYFGYEVTMYDDSSAGVLFCRDFRDVATIDAETGEVVEEANASAKASQYVTRVELNDGGVWQTTEYHFYREAEECN